MKKFLLVIATLLIVNSAQAASYDATADFQTISNPSGVWSYGYSPRGGNNYSMTLFNAITGTNWHMANYWPSFTPSVSLNPLGQLSLHAGPVANGDFSILRFTAATSGMYDIAGQFFAGDLGAMSGFILLNSQFSSPLTFFGNTTNNSIFSLSDIYMQQGQTLDFVVGNNGRFNQGATPISVTIISSVTEPETYAMLMAGLGVIGWIARHRKFGNKS